MGLNGGCVELSVLRGQAMLGFVAFSVKDNQAKRFLFGGGASFLQVQLLTATANYQKRCLCGM